MDAEGTTTLADDQVASRISSIVTWIPDLDPARRRALGEAVVALRLAHTHHNPGRTTAAAGTPEETHEEAL
jgi:hypothetical protein